MFNLIRKNIFQNLNLEETFDKFTKIYGIENVAEERKEYLSGTIEKYGYLPYPHYKVLEEMTEGEIVFCLTKILELEGSYKSSKIACPQNPSVLSRNKIKNSDWFKKENHNIKLISLSALGDGNVDEKCASFINWIAELITLPRGNKTYDILGDTIYLLPFFEREFGCAYLPKSSDISEKLQDEKIAKFLGYDAKKQVQFFICLAQLSGHPVIYDILPQTGRYSKMVLAKPYIARWCDIKALISEYKEALVDVIEKIKTTEEYETDIINSVEEKYKEEIGGRNVSYNEEEKQVLETIETLMKDIKKNLCEKMTSKEEQEKLVKQISFIIETRNGKKPEKEEDILNQNEIISSLMESGYWPMPGGAWCSAGIPVFDKMYNEGEYPLYKHYDYKNEDVTKFANLDCQTPYYFVYLENGEYNEKVIDFYVKYTEDLQKEYNFDGFRVDHIDHVVDNLSEQNGRPLSYRIPRNVLGKVNSNMKKNIPYFATLAEYMLWDSYYKEYHKDMNFDLLWGNDIVFQSSKTPKQIIQDNKNLEEYNARFGKPNHLSILKTYNNQDGEFEAIDRYPGQLEEAGALFKWFKFKFIPGGKYASRPTLYIDGDESFTQTGIERIIGREVSMIRNKNWAFYEKFNAINYFAQNSKIINTGKAKLIEEKDNGLSVWEIDSDFGSLLVISNCKNPKEKMQFDYEDGNSEIKTVYGETIYNSTINFKGRKLKSYFEFCYDENQKCILAEKPLDALIEDEITMGELHPAEFKIYGFEN